MNFELGYKDKEVLKKVGIDIVDDQRRYWFIRTQGGKYYDDFSNENFVGIEWDEISDVELIKVPNEEELKLQVLKHYPEVEKPGYPVNQIIRFSNDIKKGDIVLIPNKESKWINIGEFTNDDMYIYEEEEDFEKLLDDLQDNIKEKQILKKRRSVKWIKQVKKDDLDPYLYGIIYTHNAVSNVDKYSTFIDRTLSQFYIKGEDAYFTYKVNKKKNIPYEHTIAFLNENNRLIKFVNDNISDSEFKIEDLILKINVQSKGPIQFKGKICKILMLGMIITGLVGANLKFNFLGAECEIQTNGLPNLLKEINNIINTTDENQKRQLEQIKKDLEISKEKLEITVPEIKNTDVDKYTTEKQASVNNNDYLPQEDKNKQ